jgi:hypothetical protein
MHQRFWRRPSIASAIASATAFLAGSALAGFVLLSERPHRFGPVSTWRGDDLAFGAAWAIAFVCTVWLALTTLACLAALAHGDHRAATRIAGFAPPFARRMLQAALVTSFALAPAAAHAQVPPAPLTLHVGSGGLLTTVPESAPTSPTRADEIPVVRAPPTITTTTPTAITTPSPTNTAPEPRPTTTLRSAPAPSATFPSTTVPSTSFPATSSPSTIPPTIRRPASPRPRAATPVPKPAVAPIAARRDRTYVVRAGDNLWVIAKTEVARTTGGAPNDGQVARYWQHVVRANRGTLRSGDPSLIFPGEVVTLPLD